MKAINYIGQIILILIIVLALVISLIRLINYFNFNISGNTGISKSEFIEINDCKTFIQVRGKNVENPIIVFIHGGPGFPLSYLSPYYQRYLEDRFTFINYDQRGAGRTFYKNGNKEVSINLLIKDLDEVVNYALEKFNKRKVIIMGQSWGTLLGTMYVQQFPQHVEAYIGVGQIIDFDQGKVLSAQRAIEIAKRKEEDKIAQTLQLAIDEFESSNSIEEVNIKNLETLIKNSGRYLKGENEISGFKQMFLGITSPYMNFNDIRWYLNAANTAKIIDLEEALINHMYFEFDIKDLGLEYEVPMYFIQGENDYITPSSMVEDYVKIINAPDKELYKIQKTGHVPFLDAPKEFSKIVNTIFSKQLE